MSDPIEVPYRRYLQVLFLTNCSDEGVCNVLEKRRLPKPGIELLQHLRLELWGALSEEVREFYAGLNGRLVDFNRIPENVSKYFSKVNLGEVIDNQEAFACAKSLFDQVDLRMCVFAYAISKQPESELIEDIEGFTKYKLKKNTIPVFKKYFCDMDNMSYASWKEFIFEIRSLNHFEAQIYASCFSSKYPFALVKHKLHIKFNPDKVDLDSIIKEVTVFSYIKVLESLESGQDADAALQWIDRLTKIYSTHKTIGKGKGGENEKNILEEATFQLERVRFKPRNVLELEDPVTKVIDTSVVDSSKSGDSESN